MADAIPSPEQWLADTRISTCATCRHPGRAQIDAAQGRISTEQLSKWTRAFAPEFGVEPLTADQIAGHFRRGHGRAA